MFIVQPLREFGWVDVMNTEQHEMATYFWTVPTNPLTDVCLQSTITGTAKNVGKSVAREMKCGLII